LGKTAKVTHKGQGARMNDLTTSYFSIEKSDKQPDGTLMVYGKATDDSVDIDQQICDAAWLDRAMPAWFKSGGNIREQHSSIAAGVAKEYEPKADGHYIMAHIVDPVSVKKVDAGVLRGFSIGIKSPRVVRDTKAVNGRIIDGQIVEVSLVDRPANPNCQLVLAKSVDGESSLVQVEEYISKEKEKPNYEAINQGGEGYEPSDKELYNRVKNEAKDKFDVYPSAVANAWVVREYKKRGGTYKKEPKKDKTTEIEKHGSHNQSSHGRRGGGLSGRGGGYDSTGRPIGDQGARDNEFLSSQKVDVDDAHDTLDEFANEKHENFKFDLSQNDESIIDDASEGLKNASENIELAHGVKDYTRHREYVQSAINDLEGARDSLENADDLDIKSVGNDIDGIIDTMDVYFEEVNEASKMVKHGSHNQSSHGRRGSGGGAGGGAAGGEKTNESKKINKEKIKNEKVKVQALNDKMRKHQSAMTSNSSVDEGTKADIEQQVSDAQGHITDGKKYLTNAEKATDVSDHASQVQRAADSFDEVSRILDTGPTETLSKIGAEFRQTSKDLQSYAKDLESGKTTDADLRKALQSALHLYSLNKSEEATMDQALVELPVEVVADLLKFDAAQYESARNALARLIEVEAKEMGEGSNEIQSIGHLLQSVMHLTAWYEGEEAEGEVMEQETMIERAAKSYKNMKPAKDETKPDFMKRCKDAGMDDDAAKACWDKYMSADVDAEKSAEISKCLECGCNQPGSDHGLTTTNDFANVAKPSNVTTAEMYAPGETPKSAEGEEAATVTEEEVKAEEPATEETPAVETTEVSAEEKTADVEALVEQVVKSATESLKSEIAELVSAKEAALSKAMSLETELELAKSLAVAGGPSRTARPLNVKTTNDLLTKAAIYKAKANATTDPTLAKGYKSLAEEFLNKANEADNK